MGNLITMIAGFALASAASIDPILFLITLVGLGLVIASACVCNNYIDRHADKEMKRTKDRPTIGEIISTKSALTFALILGVVGVFMLAYYANPLAAITAVSGFIIYVAMYSLLKSQTRYATLIGSISGAIPPVVGYVAVKNRLDLGALLLFALLVLWQMPHFYSIAVRHHEDYKKASIPVLPVAKGIDATKKQIVLWIIAFIFTLPLMYVFGYTSNAYLIITMALGMFWLVLATKGFKTKDHIKWARQMFIYSLVLIVSFCGVIILT